MINTDLLGPCLQGPPKGTRNPAFTQVLRTNHAKKLPEIYVHVKFIQSCTMPDLSTTQQRILFIKFLFSRIKICPITPSRFSLWGPLLT